mmetsp:Transcript_18685/g.38869  ORF Transcript_18685/g.38869 Transcript_18685/m.38869 type:complete len:153 (+) Transcript_18685:42-500(+)
MAERRPGAPPGAAGGRKATRQAKPLEQRLPSVLSFLEGTRVVVETRSDIVIKGTLESCDERMNLFLTDAESEHLPTGRRERLSQCCVKDRLIRFVVLPAAFDPVKHLLEVQEHHKRNQEVASRRRRLMTRKQLKIREREQDKGSRASSSHPK